MSDLESPALELHMHGIGNYVKKHQLEAELALILHQAPFAAFSNVLGPVNFIVYLFKDHRGERPHSGSGSLTLLKEVAHSFLQEYGERPDKSPPPKTLLIGGRRIRFSISRSTRPLRPDVVDRLLRFPYTDPALSAQRDETTTMFQSESIIVNTLQFGWLCRDSVFSSEWEASILGTLQVGSSRFAVNEERRELRLAIPQGNELLFVAVRWSKINHVSIHSARARGIIFFHLSEPPNFESGIAGDPRAPRQRLSCLPLGDHERVAPFTSLHLRLICNNANDLSRFHRLAKAANIRNIYETEIHMEQRGLFAPDVLRQLTDHIAGLRWSVAFQVEALWRNSNLDARELLGLLPAIRKMVKTWGRSHTTSFLSHFGHRARYWMFYDDASNTHSIEEFFRKEHVNYLKKPATQTLHPAHSDTFESLHVAVTPTSMWLDGPYPDVSNRVMRTFDPKFHESFLRVSFGDEGKMQYRFDREVDCVAFTHQRVGKFLKEGLQIANRKFEFLAYSQSALKEHAVWFVRPFVRDGALVTAQSIIKALGRFDNLQFDPKLMYCPARYAARISQAFTSTSSTTVEVEEIINLPDISAPSGKYEFTDGVGTMSLELATDIWSQLSATRRRQHTKEVPRAYQVRFQGCKGMLSVDYKLKGHVLCLRPSMIKFSAPHTRVVEIARAFDRPGVYFLNRSLIMIMEGLGIPYEVFKKHQDRAVKVTQDSTTSLRKFADMLEIHGLGMSYRIPSILASLIQLEVLSLKGDKFYQKMLDFAIHHVLRLLKTKARIPIPHGVTLGGVADVHKYLKKGEIFVCTRALDSNRLEYMEGDVIISRSPTIHPGDVRCVRAIGKPPPGSPFEHEPLPNTVVFSVLGDRPLPSCLGGGDLDGDTYNLLPLSKLPRFRPRKIFKPAEYDPAEKHFVDHPSTMEDVADFFVEYINSDAVGLVATNWLLIADQTDEGIIHPDCLKLADLHSAAVDYPKTGKPVPIQSIPKPPTKSRPDWNASEINAHSKDHYPSQRAIGKLFRDIKLPEVRPELSSGERQLIKMGHLKPPSVADLAETLDTLDLEDDPLLEIIEARVSNLIEVDDYPPELGKDIGELFSQYSSQLQGLCISHTLSHAKAALLSEGEAVIGTIIAKTSQPRKRQDLMASLRDKTDFLVRKPPPCLIADHRKVRGVKEEIMGDDEVFTWEESLLRAWLALKLAIAEQQRREFGAESFRWIALGAIFEAVKGLEDESKMSRSQRL
ncbi:RNA-directed RNA polymerase 2 [Mycena amicta]|nr:RNA-directed RNA polymerase 2 [Mycena amicta]